MFLLDLRFFSSLFDNLKTIGLRIKSIHLAFKRLTKYITIDLTLYGRNTHNIMQT